MIIPIGSSSTSTTHSTACNNQASQLHSPPEAKAINKGTSALSITNTESKYNLTDIIWTNEDYESIIKALISYGCTYIIGRKEYALLKEVVSPPLKEGLTEESASCQSGKPSNLDISRVKGSGVNTSLGRPMLSCDTTAEDKPFLAPLNIQKNESIADKINTFKVVQSEHLSLNIGLDTEFQSH